MTAPHAPVLEFPAMFHGLTGAVLRDVRAQGKAWAREYLETGAFTQPRRMLQVPPGELLEVCSGILFDGSPQSRWRVHLFADVFLSLDEGVPKAERQRAREVFESFCLNSPWGTLYHAVSPRPPRSARRMAGHLAALLRFWDVLQGPRYAYWFNREDTLEQLVEDIYRQTLEAWFPRGSSSVREHLALTVERMSRATREDCTEAVLRVAPVLVEVDTGFKHREVLRDLAFLRERLAALSPEDFEDVSGAYKHSVTLQLADWDRELGRQ